MLVVDDGSTDGTQSALESRNGTFALRYLGQEHAGPGAARNLGIEEAAGDLVLFIGDDIIADERLLEQHLLTHAASPEPGTAVLGHIDWIDTAPRNAVMEYVGGDATQQFAYNLIPRLSRLDHRFFYTSNISLKREFLVDAANAGVRFDPCFRRAAFEDSEFALRLLPRGLRITYAAGARAAHDHDMDLDAFARREFGAGEMAVVFYRKHPGRDDELQVRWIADLVEPATALLAKPEFLRHLEAFDEQTDTLLRTLAGSLDLVVSDPHSGEASLSAGELRDGLHSLLRVIFDVERTRGKIQEWFSMVDDGASVKAAQTLASVMRKIEFLNLNAGDFGLPSHARPEGRAYGNARLPGHARPDRLRQDYGGPPKHAAKAEGRAYDTIAPIPAQDVESLSRQIGELAGVMSTTAGQRLRRTPVGQALRRFVARSSVLPRLLAADRFVQDRLQAASNPNWLESYRRVRRRLRDRLL